MATFAFPCSTFAPKPWKIICIHTLIRKYMHVLTHQAPGNITYTRLPTSCGALNLTIGGPWRNLHQGSIKVARIMNRAVSAQEVVAMYSLFAAAGLRPVKTNNPTTDLVYWTAGPSRSAWSPTAEYVGVGPDDSGSDNGRIGISGWFDAIGSYQVRGVEGMSMDPA